MAPGILVLAQVGPSGFDWKLGLEIATLVFAAGGVYRLVQSLAKRQDETTATLARVHDEARMAASVGQEALRQATAAHTRVDSVATHVQQLEVAQARTDERLSNANAWLRNTARLRPVEDTKE